MTEKFDVHLFALVRVKVEGIDADDMPAAIKKAEQAVHLTGMFNREETPQIEYAEEISHYLVDVQGDTEFNDSCWFLDENHMAQQNELEMNKNVERYSRQD